jgi:hypothetical protein
VLVLRPFMEQETFRLVLAGAGDPGVVGRRIIRAEIFEVLTSKRRLFDKHS